MQPLLSAASSLTAGSPARARNRSTASSTRLSGAGVSARAEVASTTASTTRRIANGRIDVTGIHRCNRPHGDARSTSEIELSDVVVSRYDAWRTLTDADVHDPAATFIEARRAERTDRDRRSGG